MAALRLFLGGRRFHGQILQRFGSAHQALTVLFDVIGWAALFRDRLLRYARTVPCPAGDVLVFEYVSLRKAERCFESFTVAEYVVDPWAGAVEERIVDGSVSVRAAHAVSPVHEGLRPGTYLPLER